MKALKLKKLTQLATLLFAVSMLPTGNAQAAACPINVDFTNPDASMSHMLNCGPLVPEASGEGPISAAGFTWTFLDKAERDETKKDNSTFPGQNGLLGMTTVLQDVYKDSWLNGTWALNLSTTAYATNTHDFLFVMADGAVGSSPSGATTTKEFWFTLDELLSCTSTTSCSGDWSMYGVGGTTKQISHLSVYYRTAATTSGNGGGPSSGTAPEPGTLSLLGLAMLGGFFYSRRRRIAAR